MITEYNTLANWYGVVSRLRTQYFISDESIMSWMPFERDLYIDMIKKDSA